MKEYYKQWAIKPKIKENEYQCANCGEIYEKGWTEEEALKEKEENFRDIPINKCAVVCDDCYKKIGF